MCCFFPWQYLDKTADNLDSLPFKLHDFGFRGCTSVEVSGSYLWSFTNAVYFHMSNSRKSMQLCTVYEKPYFYCKSHENLCQYCKSHENPYQILQVACTASECAMKLKVCVIKIIIIHLTYANTCIWESMGKPCSCTQFLKSRIFYYKSCENPYQYCKSPCQVLQVTCTASERPMKLKVHMIKSLSP